MQPKTFVATALVGRDDRLLKSKEVAKCLEVKSGHAQ